MSEKINDGGLAFPISGTEYNQADGGMTLRDWLAGQALPQLLRVRVQASRPCDKECLASNGKGILYRAAVDAYATADAMIAAREGKR